MDDFLLDYLGSGKAWVLIGSGPSTEMGYPSWGELATYAVDVTRRETHGKDLSKLDASLKQRDYPKVFEKAKEILGGPLLRSYLQTRLVPSEGETGKIYELMAQWPVPVYLTTNWDNEIQSHLVKLGETYTEYSNSEDHIQYLSSDLSGAIFKLHGDIQIG